jgi:hypothetical protein
VTALAFPLRSNPSPVRFMGEARLINCFPEETGPENRNPVAILSIPGQTEFADVTDIASRGMIAIDEANVAYSLHGSTLFEIAEDGTPTEIIGVVPGSQPVIMERGPERLMSSTVEISIASPAVVSWTNHRLPEDTAIQFSTTGSLPDGLEVGTTYYVLASGLTANSFQISDEEGGSAINTTGGQTGTHTAIRTDPTVQVVIVSDLATFCLEDGNLFFIDLPEPANSVTFLDGRWIFGTASGRYFWSELNNARVVSSLSFATAEARPDGLVRAFADRGELWLFGKTTVEVHTGSGDAELPFQPLGGSFIDKGCGARDSVVSFDNAPHWVGHDGIVYRGEGYSAVRVSTHAVETAIKAVSKATIRAYIDTDRGHSFYVLTCQEWTWALDAATGSWCERKSYQRSDWRAWPYCQAFGKRLVGDKETGRLMELTDDVFNEDGRPIRCEMILPDIPGAMIHHRVEIDVATGVGTVTDDALVMLSWSDDGGHTYGSERVVSLGREGDWERRVRFNRLGMARTPRGRRYRIAVSDPVLKAFYLGDVQGEAVAA